MIRFIKICLCALYETIKDIVDSEIFSALSVLLIVVSGFAFAGFVGYWEVEYLIHIGYFKRPITQEDADNFAVLSVIMGIATVVVTFIFFGLVKMFITNYNYCKNKKEYVCKQS